MQNPWIFNGVVWWLWIKFVFPPRVGWCLPYLRLLGLGLRRLQFMSYLLFALRFPFSWCDVHKRKHIFIYSHCFRIEAFSSGFQRQIIHFHVIFLQFIRISSIFWMAFGWNLISGCCNFQADGFVMWYGGRWRYMCWSMQITTWHTHYPEPETCVSSTRVRLLRFCMYEFRVNESIRFFRVCNQPPVPLLFSPQW